MWGDRTGSVGNRRAGFGRTLEQPVTQNNTPKRCEIRWLFLFWGVIRAWRANRVLVRTETRGLVKERGICSDAGNRNGIKSFLSASSSARAERAEGGQIHQSLGVHR